MKLSKDKEAAMRLWQSSPVYLTPDGLKRLKEKLAHLQSLLPNLIEETRRTRAYGDTSDNAEYKDAKITNRRVQRQILAIQDQLKKVEIIQPGPSRTGSIINRASLYICGTRRYTDKYPRASKFFRHLLECASKLLSN